jgi:Cu-Zn family superoxide dismutase
MPTEKQQRILLLTVLAGSTALVACGPEAADERVVFDENSELSTPGAYLGARETADNEAANIVVAQSADAARRTENAAGGLGGNWADMSENILARADVLPTEGNTGHGTVTLERAPDGNAVLVHVSLFGLESGQHGFHVHENGDCSGPDAGAAGGHLNPTGAPHGDPDSPNGQHHLGDLGNLTADDDGIIEDTLDSSDLLRNGELAVLGRAIVVHANADDLESQPSGESGDPVSCGVFRAGEEITREQGEGRAAPASQVQTERGSPQSDPVG